MFKVCLMHWTCVCWRLAVGCGDVQSDAVLTRHCRQCVCQHSHSHRVRQVLARSCTASVFSIFHALL